MPDSISAFCSIVSLTAAKTSRILEVSVAWVRLFEEENILACFVYQTTAGQ